MSDININEDSRDRGLEVLLYHPEKNPEQNDENKKFKLNLKLPLCFERYLNFQVEFFMTKKSTFLEKE